MGQALSTAGVFIRVLGCWKGVEGGPKVQGGDGYTMEQAVVVTWVKVGEGQVPTQSTVCGGEVAANVVSCLLGV